MKFSIIFSSHRGYAIEQSSRKIGLKRVDAIRNDIGVHLSIDRIAADWYGITQDASTQISETIARESGHFADTNNITVKVDKGQLNKFAHRKTVCDRDDTTGEIVSARCAWEIDTRAIIEAWIKAWYPLDWTTEAEQSA